MVTTLGYTRARSRARPDQGKLKAERLLWLHRHIHATLLLGRVGDFALAKREQCMVLADAHALARMPFRAALANDDIAGEDTLAARLLDPEPPPDRVTTITRRAACFLVCHWGGPLLLRRLACRLLGRRLGRLLGCWLLVGGFGFSLLGRRFLLGFGFGLCWPRVLLRLFWVRGL